MATTVTGAVVLCQAQGISGGIVTWGEAQVAFPAADQEITCIGGTTTDDCLANAILNTTSPGDMRIYACFDGGGATDLEMNGGPNAQLYLVGELGAAGATNRVTFARADTGVLGQQAAAQPAAPNGLDITFLAVS